MSLTLNAELAAAQENPSRRPIVEIISTQKGDDIPFDGTFLTPETFNEFSPSVIAHSSDRLCLAYCYGPDADEDCGIKYVYTNTDRTVFNTVTIELYTNLWYEMKSVSVCELTDGNVGIVCLVDDTSQHKYRLLRRIITVTGTAVSNAEIANWSHDTYTSDPWVATIDTNSYLMVYGKKSGTNYFLYTRTSSDFITWSAESVIQVDADNKGVGLLTITDSACVEDTGTYALIFTGANVTPAAGTYTVGRYVSALTIVDQLCTETNGAHDLIFIGTNTTTAIGTYTITRYVSALNIVTAACTAADGTYNLIFTGTYTTKAAGTYTVVSNTITAVNLTNPGAGYTTAPTVATQSGHGGSITADILPKIASTSIINGGSGYFSAPTVATQTGEGSITATVLPIIESTVITDKGSGYIVNPACVTQTGDGAIRADISVKRLANPSILKISTGDLWLWFDALESTGPLGEELTNVYYSVSADSGATWANAVKMTAYDSYGEIGLHPTACQKVANQMHMLFTRRIGALHMDDTATGWPTGDTTVELSWDSAKRKLYAINCTNGSGSKYLQCVVKIDVDTWTVDQYWDSTTTPGFPSFLCDNTHHVWYCNKMHDGHHIAICCVEGDHRFIWHLDGEANTITGYYADTQAEHSITSNMSLSVPNDHYARFSGLQVDATSNRIYAWIVSAYLYNPGIVFGYIDLTETSDYSFHIVISIEPLLTDTYMIGIFYSQAGGVYVDIPGNRLILAGSTEGLWNGFCSVYDMTSGGELCSWVGPTDTNFPIFGLRKPFVYGDKIYAAMGKYTSGYGQSSFRGLCEIDMISKTIKLHRPSYCTEDDHFFGRPNYVGGNKLAMNHPGYGIAVFDMVSHTWELFSNANIPGMTLSGMHAFVETQIAYDATNDIIFVGDPGATFEGPSSGVIAFSAHGYLRQSYYAIGTFSGGAWSFSTALQLVQGFRDFEAIAVPDPSTPTSIYCFWISEDADGEQSIKWDKDGSSLDLSDYLTNDEITVERAIDGNPATLSFSVSHGHLFDPYNSNSLLSIYLKKGRKLTIRFGELISGVENWQNQGTFYVQSGSIRLSRGKYPIMKIEALDQRALWQHSHVYATDIYSNTGVEILTDLMIDIADMALAEIDTFTIDGDQTLDHQWIETTLDEVLTQVCNRFGSYYRFTVDGKFSVRKITKTGAVTHTYTDQATIIAYTPDDRYSDYTNRVTVTGQERDFTVVIFPEERVAGISGTIGWWGCSKDHVVWFSYDKSRRVINLRLVVLETAMSIPMELAGKLHESLTECPESGDNKYCTVEVKAPNLIAALVANTAGAMAASFIPDFVVSYGGGITIPIGRVIQQIEVMLCTLILGSTANYQYDIYGQPLGSIRRSVQATADDTEHQAEIGCVVEQKIEDPLCYSVSDCAQVAAFELMVAQMQRKRVTITKVAHLQDEDGDTIRFKHPISGQNIDLFVTDLRRRFKKGNDGYFFDEIDGWVVNQ